MSEKVEFHPSQQELHNRCYITQQPSSLMEPRADLLLIPAEVLGLLIFHNLVKNNLLKKRRVSKRSLTLRTGETLGR